MAESKITRAVRSYEDGSITHFEFTYVIAKVATEDNWREVAALPAEYLAMIRTHLDRMPTTDEGWGKMVVTCIAMYVRNADPEQIENNRRQEAAAHRRGVELLRRHLS
jgi:hypothetical protein